MRDATPELQDAVAQARTKLFRELAQFFSSDGMIPASDPYVLAATDALIAAVEARCAAKVPPTPDLDATRKSLVDLRQHAINGWVAYGYHQMSREKAESMLREYEEALLAAVSRPAEARGEAVPSFWAVLREDNETMATGKTHDEAVREFLQYYQRDYAVAEKEGYRCVAIFTKWPAAPRPETGEVSGAMVEAGVEGWIAAINDSYSLSRMEQEVSRHEIVGRILRAALAAQREQTP